jgi:hypothetical protein
MSVKKNVVKSASLALLGLAVLAAPSVARAGLEPVNLALNGTAFESSTAYAGPSVANDGLDGGNYTLFGTNYTGADFHSWWQVDLGEERHLGTVEIINRTDCCQADIVPFVVIVADFPLIDTDITDADGFTYPGVTRIVVADAVRSTFIVPVHRKGRFVMVGLLREYTNLAMGEVKVFEEPSAATKRFTFQSSGTGNEKAVDNSIDGDYSKGGVAVVPSSTSTKLPYFDMILDGPFPIESVDVYSTNTTCCSTVTPRPTFSLYTRPDTSIKFGTTPASTLPAGVTRQSGLTQGAPATVPINRSVQGFRLQLEAVDSLSLAEVKVWALGRGSEGAYATISSKSGSSIDPFAGIDFNTLAAGNDITQRDVQTNLQTDPWYDVDLGGDRYIETIRVWGQTDLSSQTAFSVWTSEFNKFPTASPDYTAAKMRANQFATGAIEWKAVGVAPVTNVPIGQRARFIRVQVEGASQRLGLRELEIVTPEGFMDFPTVGTTTGAGTLLGAPTGFHTRPNEPVDVYFFSPNFMPGNGFLSNWAYGATGRSSSVAETSPLAVAPVYKWSAPTTIKLPTGLWTPGSMVGLYAQAYVNYATGVPTPTPQRTVDRVGNATPLDLFWPHARIAATDKSPDTNTTPPPYLTKPMNTTVASTYYNTFSSGTYKEIPDTLAQFNSRYLARGAVSANYYNVGDLGIGRKMTCAQPSWTVGATSVVGTACAVSNYAPAAPAGSKAPILFGKQFDAVTLMKNNAPPFATVVMVKRQGTAGSMFGVYVPSTSPPTTDPTKTKLVQTQVFLDSTGSNTTAPNNCMACHGGSAGSNPLDLTKPSMFLPFDPQAIGSDNLSLGWDWAHQEEAFRKLNAMVVNAGASDGIKDFVNGSYGNKVGTSGTKIDPNYIPQGWQRSAAQKEVYTKVIKPYCRGCHMSQSGALAFTNASDIEGLRATVLNEVCKTHIMPHSQVTTQKAWSSAARATLLSYFGRDDLDATTLSLEACKP